ncbi:heavy metal translocating P-type ATPase [Cyanobium sp. CH-040]|uniref:heavy metal translocating P-type ATPase n=1 Tax=Cyanobium sp. CH-040 TaxID=2823708 RepID=UPI0020CEC193|nr:heavy metal translocating P-type ATPase [Cyanobium sp. CH-040]MCP9928884.1 heavy metal translocating P-type ATPase [Cyanobium sp. CH-040]
MQASPATAPAEAGGAARGLRARWLEGLERLHVLENRVRWAYTLPEGVSHAPRQLAAAIGQFDGVLSARENPVLRSLVVVFDRTRTSVESLEDQLLSLVAPLPRGAPAVPLHASGLAWLPVGLSLLNLIAGRFLSRQAQLAATAAIAWPIWRQAAADVGRLHLGSHLLEATAVLVSLRQRDLTAANATTFLLLLAEVLEESIGRRSDALLLSLLRPMEGQVWVLREGVEMQMPLAELRGGETVVLTAGAIVPVDGTVLGGQATLNEAAMTGESRPTAKERGDSVLSGTVVEEGRLLVYAEQVGAETAAAKISAFVRDSLASRSAVQLQASRLADRLVPAVFGLAGLTLLFSRSWRRTAAVLQADYCCALKLSMPVAFKAAMARAGSQGVLVKGASALERLAQADTVVFDKTGTLTTGRLEVSDTISFDSAYSPADILNLAASIEEHAVHPVALAVVEAARGQGYRHFEHTQVEFVVAHGVASAIGDQRVVVGSPHFVLEDEGIDPRPHQAAIEPLLAAGKTLLPIGFAGRLIGVVALQDQLRTNSRATVERLRALGARRVLMLSGDRPEVAERMGASCGLDGVHAGLLPADKARIVAELIAAGSRVVFVGDGINDAPALAGASVGIAMSRGAEVARLSADITLLDDDIARVADVKAIANATMARIDANYLATVGINSGILGAAAMGWLSPVRSSLLHNGSTVAILLSALATASGATPGRGDAALDVPVDEDRPAEPVLTRAEPPDQDRPHQDGPEAHSTPGRFVF